VAAAPAHAGLTVKAGGKTLTVTGAPAGGKLSVYTFNPDDSCAGPGCDTLFVSQGGVAAVVNDTGGACTVDANTTLHCPPSFTDVRVILGDEDDEVRALLEARFRATIYTQGGDDTIYGGDGSDTLVGGDGADTIYGEPQGAPIPAGGEVPCPCKGGDFIDGGAGEDVLKGLAGNDIVRGGSERDKLYGGKGIDTADYSDHAVNVIARLGIVAPSEQGEDFIAGNTFERLRGGTGNDQLEGDKRANLLEGGPGTDTIKGGEGDDTIDGGSGGDLLFGEGGEDAVTAGPGGDGMNGGPGADVLNPGPETTPAPDTINGGADFDFVSYEGADIPVEVRLDGKTDDGERLGGKFLDRVGPDVEGAKGSEQDDILVGNDGPNSLYGLGGADRLTGSKGKDLLFGGDGSDKLFSKDTSSDRDECGLGFDSAVPDLKDIVIGCEQGPFPGSGSA
jgi:Ca2+-binding RTX toxin-like protein